MTTTSNTPTPTSKNILWWIGLAMALITAAATYMSSCTFRIYGARIQADSTLQVITDSLTSTINSQKK